MSELRVTTASIGTEPLCVDRAGLADLLNVSLRQIDRLDSGGKLPVALAFGRCRRWSVSEIEDWVAAGAPDRRTWASMRRSGA